MARAASAVEEGPAAAHTQGNAWDGSKVAAVEEGGHGGAVNVRHACNRAEPARLLKHVARNADQQVMRRLLALALVAALTITATAVAATPSDGTFQAQKGKVQKGYELSFSVTAGGRKVTGLHAKLLATCADTSALALVTSRATWTVRGGKFAGRKKETRAGTTVYTTFEGQFTSKLRAAGSLRQVTVRAGRKCDTYKVPFTAKRG